jgi:arsenate reductase
VIQVVFACVHNAGRSQMAAILFNAAADPEKARAVSAGTSPGERVHPEVVSVMGESGFDLSAVRPRQLTPELTRDASLLVTLGCGEQCPVVPGLRTEDWPLEDPKGKPRHRVQEIRAEIQARVARLIDAEDWARTAAAPALDATPGRADPAPR